MDINGVVNGVVKRALAPFQKEFDQGKWLQFVREDGTRLEMTQAEYVYFYYQTYESGDASDTAMVSMTFKLATGKILEKSNFSESILDIDIQQVTWGEHEFDNYPEFFSPLAKHMYACVSRSNIYVMNINVCYKNEWHRNLVIFSGDASKIYAYVYEPNGNFTRHNDLVIQKMHLGVTEFLQSLGSILENVSLEIEDNDKTCPVGLQSKSKEKYGLCVMFTYFWMYVVFKLVDHNISLKYAIGIAEEAMIAAMTEKQIVSTVFNFALHLIDQYMTLEPYNPTARISKAHRMIEREQVERPREILPKTARIPQPQSPLTFIHSTSLTKYGRECKEHNECETQFCNRGKCDHNPEYDHNPKYETPSVETSMQSFLENVREYYISITAVDEVRLFEQWVDSLRGTERETVINQRMKYQLRFRRLCKQFEPRDFIDDDEHPKVDDISDGIDFSLNTFVKTYNYDPAEAFGLFFKWISLLTSRQKQHIHEHHKDYQQRFYRSFRRLSHRATRFEHGKACQTDHECATSYCNENNFTCDTHPLLTSLQKSMEDFCKTIETRKQSSRLLFWKWVMSIGEEYDEILQENLFTYVNMFQHRLEDNEHPPELIKKRQVSKSGENSKSGSKPKVTKKQRAGKSQSNSY